MALKYRAGLAIGALCVMAALGIQPTASAADHEWKFFTYFGANDHAHEYASGLRRGRHQGYRWPTEDHCLFGGELPYKFSDVLRLVATNQVQMGDLAVGLNAGELPGMNVFDLPFLCTTFDTFFKATEKVGPTVEAALQSKFGVGPLSSGRCRLSKFGLTSRSRR